MSAAPQQQPTTPPVAPLVGKELTNAIVKQIEFYFSTENLRRDHYLVSQMNTKHQVPLPVIAGFNKMREMSSDINVIVDAIQSSPDLAVEVDATGAQYVGPKADRSSRSTLIVREVPSSIKEAEIRALTTQEVLEAHPDIGECWFLKFRDETACREAFFEMRQKTLGGMPVKARIKSENIGGFLPDYNVMAEEYKPPSYDTYYHQGQGRYGQWFPGPGPNGQGGHWEDAPQGYAPAGAGYGRGAPQQGGAEGDDADKKNKAKKNKSKKKEAAGPSQKPAKPPGPQDFPPLLAGDAPPPKPQPNVKRYTRDEIQEVHQKMKGAEGAKPVALPSECSAVLKAPNTALETGSQAAAAAAAAPGDAGESRKQTFAEAIVTKKDIKPTKPKEAESAPAPKAAAKAPAGKDEKPAKKPAEKAPKKAVEPAKPPPAEPTGYAAALLNKKKPAETTEQPPKADAKKAVEAPKPKDAPKPAAKEAKPATAPAKKAKEDGAEEEESWAAHIR